MQARALTEQLTCVVIETSNYSAGCSFLLCRPNHERPSRKLDMEKIWVTALSTLSSFAMMRVILRLRRRRLLSFQYTVGWLAFFGLLILTGALLSFLPKLAESLQLSTGVVVGASAGIVLTGLCIQLSISISILQERVQLLSEEAALVKNEINGIESRGVHNGE